MNDLGLNRLSFYVNAFDGVLALLGSLGPDLPDRSLACIWPREPLTRLGVPSTLAVSDLL